MRVRNWIAGLLAVAVWTAAAAGAPAQESRLIDTRPGRNIAAPPGDHAELDLDLEIEERRDARDRGSEGPSWIAAAAFVTAGGLAFLLLAWTVRRRDR
jgi:hypothetical protein